MPRKAAVKVPGAPASDAAPAIDPVVAAVAAVATEKVVTADTVEDAQAKANRIGRAVSTPEGWICPHPSSQKQGKA